MVDVSTTLKDVTLVSLTEGAPESVWRALFRVPPSIALGMIGRDAPPCGCMWFENCEVLDCKPFPTRQACETWAQDLASRSAWAGFAFIEAQQVVKREGK